VSLFGEAGDDLPEPRLMPIDDWLQNERLAEEHRAIGFYLSGHPLDDYMLLLKRKGVMSLSDVSNAAKKGALIAKMAGAVSGKQERKSARGNRFAFVQLSDPTGLYEVTVFSDTLEACREHLETGANVVLSVEATMEADQLKLLARSITPVDGIVADAGGMGLRVFVDQEQAILSVKSVLDKMATGKLAKGPIEFCVSERDTGTETTISAGLEYPLTPQIKGAIKSLGGVVLVEDI